MATLSPAVASNAGGGVGRNRDSEPVIKNNEWHIVKN